MVQNPVDIPRVSSAPPPDSPVLRYQLALKALEDLEELIRVLESRRRTLIRSGTQLTGDDEVSDREQRARAAGGDTVVVPVQPVGDELSDLNRQLDFLRKDWVFRVETMVAEFPEFMSTDRPGLVTQFGPKPSAGRAPVLPTIMRGPEGHYAVLDPFTGSVIQSGQIPGWEDKPNLQIITDRNGNLIAVDPNDPAASPVMLIKGFGFPEIDPQVTFAESVRQFEEQIAIRRQEVAGMFIGLELERRGQMIEAITQDFAFQIDIGQMTYQEAQLNLNRINSALDQRRAERAQLLELGVTRASLVERGGETLTQLPGGTQLAAILSAATGQEFGPGFTELATGV
ncbi:hypothetical protein LCGC14_2576950, partial [marine sediment metagenome]